MTRLARDNTPISLFSGAGGLDIGVDRSEFKMICAVEVDANCTAT